MRRIKATHLHASGIRPADAASEDPRACCSDLWGPDIRFDTAKLNMKCAGFGAPVEWHQDWAFYPHTNDNLAAVGVMMDDMAMENGPLMIIPGSHRGPIFDHHADGVFCGAMDPTNRDVDYAGAIPLTGRGRIDHRASRARGARLRPQRLGPRPPPAAVPVPRRRCLAAARLSRRHREIQGADGGRASTASRGWRPRRCDCRCRRRRSKARCTKTRRACATASSTTQAAARGAGAGEMSERADPPISRRRPDLRPHAAAVRRRAGRSGRLRRLRRAPCGSAR